MERSDKHQPADAPPADVDDVSASTASAALETSVASSSTTIASSSLSTFSQTATVERGVEQAAEEVERGGDGGHHGDGLLPPAPPSVAPTAYALPFLSSATEAAGGEETSTPPVATADVPVSVPAAAVPPRPSFSVSPAVDVDGEKTAEKNAGNAHDPIEEGDEQGTAEKRREADNVSSQPPRAAAPSPSPLRASGAETDESHNDNDGSTRRSLDLSGDAGGAGGDGASAVSQLHVNEPELNDGGDLGVQHSMSVRSITSGTRASTDAAHSLRRPRHGSHASSMEEEVEASAPLATQHRSRISATADSTVEQLSSVEQDDRTDAQGGGDGDDEASRADAPLPPPPPEPEGGEEEDVEVEVSTTATRTQREGDVRSGTASSSVPTDAPRRRRRGSGSNPQRRRPHSGPRPPATAALSGGVMDRPAESSSLTQQASASSSQHRHRLQLDAVRPQLITVDAPVATLTLDVASTRSSLPSTPLVIADQQSDHASGKRRGERRRAASTTTAAPAVPNMSSPAHAAARQSRQENSWSTPLFPSSEEEEEERGELSEENIESRFPQPQQQQQQQPPAANAEEEEAAAVVGTTFVVPVHTPARVASLSSTENVLPTEAQHPSQPRQQQRPLSSSTTSAPQPLPLLPLSATETTGPTLPQSTPSPSPAAAATTTNTTAPVAASVAASAAVVSTPSSPLPHTPRVVAAPLSSVESGEQPQRVASPLSETNVADGASSGASPVPLPQSAPHPPAAPTAPPQAAILTSSEASSGAAAAATTPPSLPAALPVTNAAEKMVSQQLYPRLRASTISPPQLVIDESIETSSITAAASLTLESARHTGPRLSLSGIPINSLGGQSPLAMAQFANRGTVSADESSHHRHNGNGDSRRRNGSRSSSSYSYYSYSYTGSYTSDEEDAADTPRRTSAPRVQLPAVGVAQGSTSMSSTAHHRELSVTRVGPADGPASTGYGVVVGLTAYEEITAAAAKDTAKPGGALRFLRCLAKKPAERTRTWRTEEHVAHTAVSALMPAQPPHSANAEGSASGEGEDVQAVAAAGTSRRRGTHTVNSASNADPLSATASAAGEVDEESTPEVGSMTEAAHDRDSRRVATEEAGNDTEDAIAVTQTEGDEGDLQDVADSPSREGAEQTAAEEAVKDGELAASAESFSRGAGASAGAGAAAAGIDAASHTIEPLSPASADDHADTALLPPTAAETETSASAMAPPQPLPQLPAAAEGEAPPQSEDGVPESKGGEAVQLPAPTPSSPTDSEGGAADLQRGGAVLSDGATSVKERDTSTSASVVVSVNDNAVAEGEVGAAAAVADQADEAGLPQDLSAKAAEPEDAEALNDEAAGEVKEEETLKEEEPPLGSLQAFYVYEEHLPRFTSWDAEPPTAADAEDDEEEGSGEKRKKKESLQHRLAAEAAAASEAAAAALQSALHDMAVHPPRQCLFVEVRGLLQLSATLLWPRSTQASPTDPSNTVSAFTAPRAPLDVWRGGGEAPRATADTAASLNGVATVDGVAEETPEWTELRLALYANDRQHCIAAGSTFTVPANAAAVRRSCGHAMKAAVGAGRDSWSDVLVYQVDEGTDVTESEISAAGALPEVGNGTNTPRTAGSSASARSSAFNAAAVYLQLEEKRERWVPVVVEEPHGAPDVPRSAAAVPLAAAESDADESVEWRTDSERSGAVSAPPSEDPPTGRHISRLVPGLHSNTEINGGSTAEQAVAVLEEDEVQLPLRLEEHWDFLAVSPPLPMAQLKSGPAGGISPFYLTMATPPSLQTPLMLQQQEGGGVTAALQSVSCRVQWAVEPPPPVPLPVATPAEQQQQQHQDRCAAPTWASLGEAIAQYEMTCRGGEVAYAGDRSAASPDREGAAASPPVTVLWETIRTPAAALQCQTAESARGASLPQSHRLGHGWRSGAAPDASPAAALPLPPHTATRPHRPAVCSVVMRCAAALVVDVLPFSTAAVQREARGLTSTYCVPTVLAVTGGMDGLVAQTAAAVDRTALQSRTPVMHYNLAFHAILTREDAPTLLLTVRSAAMPSLVFGFAEWNPFERAEQVAGVESVAGGLMDVWLPLYASSEAAVTAADAQERRRRSPHLPSSSSTSSTFSPAGPSQRGGMVRVGWLHCDVEVVFLSSLTEAAVRHLWNGTRGSLMALQRAAEQRICKGEQESYHHNDDDVVMDFSVVEAVGLQPLETRFGAPLPPVPFTAQLSQKEAEGDAPYCTRVYCELVAVQNASVQPDVPDGGQQNTLIDNGGGVAANSLDRRSSWGVGGGSGGAYGLDASAYSRGSAGGWGEARRGRWCPSASMRGPDSNGGAGLHAELPVTAAVTQTNHPRWQHTFRCGLAALSSLRLRVFERSAPDRSRSDEKDRRGAVRVVSSSRSVLLGTAVVSPQMLRRIAATSGEGSAWLPLLWSAGASTAVAPVSRSRGISPALSNGYVLLQWRRANSAPSLQPPRLPLLATTTALDELRSGASVTYRCRPATTSAAAATRRREAREGPFAARAPVAPLGSAGLSPSWWWPQGPSSFPGHHTLTWMHPALEPWLWVHGLRLQWPWLQHLLCLYGGHLRLSLSTPFSDGAAQTMGQLLLVPLTQLVRTTAADRRRQSRISRMRSAATSDTSGGSGVFGVVSPASLCLDAFHRATSSSTRPLESTFCLPASPAVSFAVWWFPNSAPFPTMETAVGSACCPPRVVGRSMWTFPPLPESEEDGTSDTLSEASTSEDAEGGGEDASLRCALHRFFTPHESAVRLSAVHGANVPPNVAPGVLRWQLSSVPRLISASWDTAVHLQQHEQTLPNAPPSAGARAGGEGKGTRWRWPEVGTAATLQLCVQHLLWLHHADDAAVVAAAGNMCVAVAAEAPAPAPTTAASTQDAPCCAARDGLPSGDVPRVPYVVSSGGGSGAAWSEARSSRPVSVCSSSHAPSLSLSARGGQPCLTGVDGREGGVRGRAATVELRWSPRRYEWFDDDAPTATLWIVSPLDGSERRSAEGAGAAADAAERVWGAVRLPRLEALTTTSGVMWLPLFRTYTATGVNRRGSEEASTSPPQQQVRQADDDAVSNAESGEKSLQAASDAVEHVGFAAVAFSHNFAAAAPEALPRSDEPVRHVGSSPPSVRTGGTRLLLVEVGLLRCRCADAVVRAATPPPSLRAASAGAVGNGAAQASASYSLDNFTASSGSTPVAGPALELTPADRCVTGDAAQVDEGAEVLLGFADRQLSVPVRAESTSSAAAAVSESSQQSWSCDNMAVFPWPPAAFHQQGEREVGAVRVQTRLQNIKKEKVAAGSTFCVTSTDPSGGAQWVPLFACGSGICAAAGDATFPEEAECVLGEVLVRWRVLAAVQPTTHEEAPATTTTSASEAAAAAAVVAEALRERRLVETVCGGSGSPCTYAILDSPAATLHTSLASGAVGGTAGAAAAAADGAGAVVSRVRAWAASLQGDTGVSQTPSPAPSSALHTLLCRGCSGPVAHPWVYLLVDPTQLLCSAAHCRAWPQLTHKDPDSATDTFRFRLEVRMEWPASWRRASASAAGDGITSVEGKASVPHTIAESSPLSQAAGALMWGDAADVVLSFPPAHQATASAEHTADAAAECAVQLASASPLCLPLPSAEHIRAACGPAGLAARFTLFLRLVALPPEPSADTQDAATAAVIVGVGSTPLVYPSSMQLCMTTLTPPSASADQAKALTASPLLLSWSAQVVDALPLPQKAVSVALAPPTSPYAAPQAVEGIRGDAYASAALDRSGPFATSNTSTTLTRLTVHRMEVSGVDVSLASGAAQRHRQALPPATVAVMVGGGASEKEGAAGATTVLLSPSLTTAATNRHAAAASAVSRTTQQHAQQQHAQRYSWTAEVCAAAESTLVFYVRVPEASLRATRGEEMWATPDGDDRRDVVGKAVYTFDAAPARHSHTNGTPALQEIVLDLESPTEERWMGRLWLKVERVSTDALLRTAPDVFLSTSVSAAVHHCTGLVAGDLPLLRSVEETYDTLRERVRQEHERRGSIPRRLRLHMREVRRLRRQVGKQSENTGEVRLVCTARDGVDERAEWTSRPFQLPSALALVRGKLSRRGESGLRLSTKEDFAALPSILLRVTRVAQGATASEAAAADSAIAFELRLVAATGAADDHDVLAVGQVRLPLRAPPRLSLSGSQAPPLTWVQRLTVPLTHSLRNVSQNDKREEGEVAAPPPLPVVVTAAPNTYPALDVTATWSTTPQRGETFLTCLFLSSVGSGPASAATCGGHRHWRLRWVYCFEASARPAEEHIVETPLSLRPSARPIARRRRAAALAGRLAVSSQQAMPDRELFYWSGATTRLPCVGAVGAALRRVELVEATPASSHASADTQQEGGNSREEAATPTTWLTTRLAVHTWTVDDELRLRANRRAAQETGSDAQVWLDLRSDAAAAAGAGRGRRGLHFQVLLSLYTSSAVARQATQLLEKQAERQWESVTVTERTEREKRFPAHPGLFPRSQERLNAAVAAKASRTAAATTAAAPLSATTRDISDDAEKLGGVVIKSLVFTGSGATLAAAGLKRIDSVTCRVLRQPEIAAHTRGTAPSAKVSPSLVLEVGPAVRVLQIRETSCEDATTTSTAVAVAPSSPSVPALTDVRVAATWASLDCGAVSSSSTAAPSSCWLHRQPQSLVRLDAPTGAAAPPHRAIAGAVDDSNDDGDSTEASEDAAVYLEVVFRGGDTVARFTTSHFSASSILRSVACSEEALPEKQEESEAASLSWSSRFPLEWSEQPAMMPGTAIAPCEVEMQWGLDVLGIHPVRAVVPCVCAPTSKTVHRIISAGGVAGEESDGSLDKDADNEDDDDDDGVRQLEGCAAWTEFLASLRTQDQQKDSEAHLRHWRCRVTAVEVEGLELPVWGSTTAAAETTTLLAQLCFATTRGRDGQTGEEKDGANHVLGVARTTVRRTAAVRANTTTQGVGHLGNEEEEEEEMAAGTLWSSLRRQAALSCRATFAPLDWCITAHDMMRGGSLSSHPTQDNDSTDSTSTAAGLTLWQLLCPTSAATDMREVCALGAVSLALLLREGALVLAQVLARWCSGACSTEARDTMLRAAAALPTQWMPLTSASSFLPDTLQMEERAEEESGFGWDRSRSGCGPRVRLYYTFFYDGPPCSTPRALPSSHSAAAVTAASAQQPRLPVDAVYCAQLDHVQLRYSHSAGAAGDVMDRAAASWLSRAQLQLRVVRTVRGGAACGGDDASPVSRQTLTQWTTRLAPLPAAPPPPPPPARHSELSPASKLTHAIAAAPAPVPVPIPVPVPVPVPVVATTTEKASGPVPSGPAPAAESTSEAQNCGDAVATAAAAAVVVLPAIPAANCFCWQPQSTASQFFDETATLSVEVTVVVLEASAHAEKVNDEDDDVAVVVGQDRVVIADSQRCLQRWDSAENRLDTGWRLTEPLAVSISVHATFPQTADGSGAVTNASVAFDLLAFVAPSWGQVAALQAVRQARDARHASSLEALQRAERQLLTAVAAIKTATPVPTINTALTLHQLSTAFAARPYRLLKLPPAVYRLDSFAVVDVIPAMRDVMHAGQWVWSCGGEGGASHGRCLVDANSGAVCSPAWRLLPSLPDTTQRSGELDGDRSDAHRRSETQSTLFGLPAGRALLQEVARLRLDWRCSTDASFATSSCSRMPGKFGSVALFFVAANGKSCLWVSGGLRALRDGAAQDAAVAKVRAAQARQRREGSVVSPTPPPRCMAAAGRSSPRRRRSSAVDASVRVGGTEATPTAAVAALERPSWCCEVDASAAAPTGDATRIFHTATQLGERVWLLGGWQNRGDSQALWTTTTTATGSPTAASACVGSGLVQRRRSEVRLAATPATDLAGAAASPSALQWCDDVSCVQSLADGRPAPPVDIVAKTDSPDNAPRVACHVAVACERRHVVVFGGLVPGGRIEQEAEKPSMQLASATADVLAYDTVQGTWMRLAAATAESGGGHWPMPRYGHSCAVLPGTGETSPHSYLVVGGATTLESGLSCALVPPEELLWVWTPHLDADGGLYCTWRVVQTPADMPSPLQGRFLPQVAVLSAAEVVAFMQSGGETAGDGAALDAGLTSLVLCVVGGMTEAREVPSAMSGSDVDDAGALRAFRQCVAPWLQSPVAAASAVLLSAMCERPPLEV